MASGDIVTNIADKNTLDACYAILQGLKDTATSGAATSGELAYATATTSDVLEGKTFYSGNNVLKTGTIPVKSSATYGALTTDQVISGGQYLAGDQTIAAVTQSNLNAENIVKDVTIAVKSNGVDLWNITGAYEVNVSEVLVGYIIGYSANSEGARSATGGAALTSDVSYSSGTLTIETAGKYVVRVLSMGTMYNYTVPTEGTFNYSAGATVTLKANHITYGTNDGGARCALLFKL